MTCDRPSEITELSNDDALNFIGRLIDQAIDSGNSNETSQAFALLDLLAERNLSPEHEVLLHYFTANAWENRIHENGDIQSWAWEQPALQNQLLALRRAISHSSFSSLDKPRQCQILTNFANKLDAAGRFIEAIATWDRAIAIDGRFAMAHGNRGTGLCSFANVLYDFGHAVIFRFAGVNAFEAATHKEAHFDNEQNKSYRRYFSDLRAQAAEGIDFNRAKRVYEDGFKNPRLGRSKKERAYRTWVLQSRLFLNPLNDLGENPIASHDVLTLPNITIIENTSTSAGPPAIFGMYNQMKQEFVSARFLFFDGITADRPHFSDKGVVIYNTLDYPSYSLAVEKMRAAYRLAYSLFDKVAYFLNHYLGLGHSDSQVNFRNVWYERKGKDPKPLLALFKDRPNWPLRGLFWLSKDLFEPEFKQVMEPEGEALAELRHHLEHKFAQLHESWMAAGIDDDQSYREVGFHIGRDEFAEKTLHVLKLARASLLYLSLAVHREEQIRFPDGSDRHVLSLPLDTWEDDWKT